MVVEDDNRGRSEILRASDMCEDYGVDLFSQSDHGGVGKAGG